MAARKLRGCGGCLAWPFIILGRMLAIIIELGVRLIAVALGIVLMLIGVCLCLTLVGAILGVPVFIVGLWLAMRGALGGKA